MTTTAVGFSYASLATGQITAITSAMNTIVNAELSAVLPTVKALGTIYVVWHFFMLMSGNMGFHRFATSCVRLLIVVYLIIGSGHYAQRVLQPMFTSVPQAISSAALASTSTNTSSTDTIATQLDKTSASVDQFAAKVFEKTSIWSPNSFANAFSASIANGATQLLIALIAGIWVAGLWVMAVIICFGPYVLAFELFDRTRGFVDQWIGKIVGALAFGLGTAIVLALEINGMTQLISNAITNMPASAGEDAALLWHVVAYASLALVAMLILPGLCAFGSGTVAGHAGVVMGAAMRGGSAVTGAARGAVGQAARLSPAVRNSVSSS